MQGEQDETSYAQAPAELAARRFRAIPSHRTLGEILAANRTAFGKYALLSYEAATYTNLALFDQASRLAAALRRAGVKPADRVVVSLPNCPEVWICYFAFSALGATIVPTLPSLTFDELAFVLIDSGAAALIADGDRVRSVRERRSLFPDLKASVPVGGEGSRFAKLIAAENGLDTEVVARPEDLAAIVYTSGTTGKPKGVMISQRSLCRQACLNYGFYVGPGEDARAATLLMPLPMSHVFGLAVTVASLLMGNLVVLMRRFDAARAVDLVRSKAVRIVPAVPTMLVRLADQPGAPAACRSVVQWDCGGAPLPLEVRARVERELGGVVTEGWGLSETAGTASQELPGVPRKAGSAGLPLPGIEIVVRSEYGADCAAGEVGELLVRGETVMQGYWNQPEATAETLDAAGFVHTGDLGYVDGEGYCFLLGRKDDMIIRGGENISPREIEDTIQRHSDVADVAVIGIPDPILGSRVGAFVIARPGSAPTSESIQGFCRERLARHKVPETVELLEELPRTSTGKVMKRELRSRRALEGTARPEPRS